MKETPMVRLMRGQVVVREDREAYFGTSIVIPDVVMANERARRTHRGTVIAMGPPARVNGTGAEVPHGFAIGDTVVYHFVASQKNSTIPWPPDGKPATWIRQADVNAVIE